MAASTQQKLGKIFPQSFQIKRLMKQITDLKQLREKGSFDVKMTITRNQSLNFKIQIQYPGAYKNVKLPEAFTKLVQEVKVVVKQNYPAHPPKLFFMNDNMTKYGLKPFRDYVMQVLGESEWSAKFTITQIIKSLPLFLQKIHTNKSLIAIIKTPTLQQNFQIQSLYSWKFCQVHPVKLSRRTITKQGFIYIDIINSEIIILEDVGMQSTFSTCDYIKGSEIQNIYKKKNTSNRFILQVKLNYPKLSGKYGIQFTSQDHEALITAIMDCARISESSRKPSSSQQIKANQSSSQDQQFQADEAQPRKYSINNEEPININEIVEGIVVYESLVDNKMTSQNIRQLVDLLQKAIQYYSARSDERYSNYLNKLQSIFSNEMAQALLQSTNDQKKKAAQANTINKQQYKSVIDLL